MDEVSRKPKFWPLDRITFTLICASVLAIHFALWDAARLSAGPEQWSNAEYFLTGGFSGPMFKLLLCIASCAAAWVWWTKLGTPRELKFPWVLAGSWPFLLTLNMIIGPDFGSVILLPPTFGYIAYRLFRRNARLGGRVAVLLAALFCASSLHKLVSQRLVASDASRVAAVATQLDAAYFTQASAARDGDAAAASQAAAQMQTLTSQLRAELPSDRSDFRSEVLARHTALVTTADRASTTIAGVQQAGGANPATLNSPEQSAARLADLRTAENTAIAYVNLLAKMSSPTAPAPAESWRPIPAAAVFNREYRPLATPLAAELAHATRTRDIVSAQVVAVSILNEHQGNWQLKPDGAVQFSPTVPAETVAAYTTAAQLAARARTGSK